MENYNIWVDVLNKYSQLTPWVQAVLGLSMLAFSSVCVYCVKEVLCTLFARSCHVNEIVVYPETKVEKEK